MRKWLWMKKGDCSSESFNHSQTSAMPPLADLGHAAECARQILQRDLHSATEREDKRLLRCLNTALIVSYARPFSGNKGSPDVRKKLPPEYLDVLSDEQRKLHNYLVESRNQDHAHSDAKGMDMTVRVATIRSVPIAVPISRDGSAPLPRESAVAVAELIKSLEGRLVQEQIRIQGTLEEGECF